ncbi:MAG: nucleosidase [Chitinophagaceae bacterium]|nr:MAG: nucleosidase [Chitinophagaceae bacterium]
MIQIHPGLSIAADNILFCFALPSEAADVFEGYNRIFTGIGKVAAAYELTKALQAYRPALVINLGSAGSNFFRQGDIVCCTGFIQRDMDVRGLGFELYETPFSGIPTVLRYGHSMDGLPDAICGTGDSFEMAHATTLYNVVDMEAYALALVAQKENVPFLCLKYISDGADGNAAGDWAVQVHNAALAFRAILRLGTTD